MSAATAQGMTPNGAAEAARFTRVVAAVNSVGYAHAAVIGHGSNGADALFVLTATRGDSAMLLATVEPGGSAAHPVVVERAAEAAELASLRVEIAPFLDLGDVFDIQAAHHPLTLETTHTFVTHHIYRRQGEALSAKCDFDGVSVSSSSKGVGSNLSVRLVMVEPVPGQPMSFMLTAIEKTMRQQDREPPSTVDSTMVTRRYELQPTGTCRVLKPE